MIRILILSLVLTVQAWACSVPVFRYALERWPEDPHLLSLPANIDPGKLSESLVNAWAEKSENDHAVFSFPDDQRAWYEGPITQDELPALFDSPLRRSIAAELAGGTTCVFVWLGDAGPELERIRSTLKRLKAEVTLPEEDPLYDETDPSSQLESGIPLRVQFSLHQLKDDPAERWFRKQVLALNPEYSPEQGPMLAAIYGRGRAFALSGEMLSNDTLEELAWFLCGACSCQVKSLNPGVDLLMAMDWETPLWDYPNPVTINLPDGSSFKLTPTLGNLEPPPAAPQLVAAAPEEGSPHFILAVITGLFTAGLLFVIITSRS